jgi:7,8-dihydropterin-6-yl-methyl-4-(beta-D-ribofuranosyl)aminobenzene 5'-phosphate synthase
MMPMIKQTGTRLFLILALIAATLAGFTFAPLSVPRITILYDNTVADASCTGDWGFAALITGYEKTILFDTGTKADLFLANASRLKVDFGAVDVVVISHDHGDHTAGLPAALPKMRDPLIFLPVPASSLRSISLPPGGKSECRETPSTICTGARLTGILGTDIREQGLVLETAQGTVLITGCAHPGIVAMIDKVKTDLGRPIDIVLGGFHLMNHTETQVNAIIARVRELGVKKIGATHCTGEAAIDLFRKAFGADFIELGAGRTIHFGDLLP